MTDDIMKKVIDFICKSFMVERGDFQMDTSLHDKGIIDSFGIVEISAFIKKEFGIKVTSSDISIEKFDTVNKIVDFISKA